MGTVKFRFLQYLMKDLQSVVSIEYLPTKLNEATQKVPKIAYGTISKKYLSAMQGVKPPTSFLYTRGAKETKMLELRSK